MINRSLIRNRVLQALYASRLNGSKGDETLLKRLLDSVYELYFMYIRFLLDCQRQHEQSVAKRKQKIIPTETDLLPNQNFVKNKVLRAIAKGKVRITDKEPIKIEEYIAKNQLSWIPLEDEVEKYFRKFQKTEVFNNYLQLEKPSWDEDQQILLDLLVAGFADDLFLPYISVEKSEYYRSVCDYVGEKIAQSISKTPEGHRFWALSKYSDREAEAFAFELFRKTVLNWDKYANEIDLHTRNWEQERLSLIDVIILQMAINEFIYFPSIPVKVTINESIELAKNFSGKNSPSFVNGVLDKVSKKLQDEQKIAKTGRGLR